MIQAGYLAAFPCMGLCCPAQEAEPKRHRNGQAAGCFGSVHLPLGNGQDQASREPAPGHLCCAQDGQESRGH